MKDRQQNVREQMQRASIDAVLLTSAPAIRYYTGFTSDECAVILTRRGCSLITDFRYAIQAAEQTDGCSEVIEANGQALQLDEVRRILQQDGCKVCGFEQDAMSVAAYGRYASLPVEWRAFGDEINRPRRIKSAKEIDCLQRAQRMADEAFAALLPRLSVGMTELQMKAELNYLCEKCGSEGPSFDPIVGSGENGAMCHAVPTDRVVRNGDLVVFDFGCVYNGYHSDMTRTIGFGSVSDELCRVYDVVLHAQQQALSAVHAGISGKALDAVARDCIAAAGYGENFGHGLGHGFGLEIHEPPRAAATSDNILEAGMTVTVEPGVYLEGKGGVRIEDCVVVTEDGCLNLVSTAKDLLIL